MRGRPKNNRDLNNILDNCIENCNMEWQCGTPEQTKGVTEVNPAEQVTLIQLPNADLNNSQEIDLEYAFKLGANIKSMVDNILTNASNVDVKPDNTFSYIFDNHEIVQRFIEVNNTLYSLSEQLNNIMDALNNQYVGSNAVNNNEPQQAAQTTYSSDPAVAALQLITGDIQF